MKSIALTIVLSFINGLIAVNDTDVTFLLYTSPNQNSSIQVDKTNATQNINPAGQVVFIIHGWMSSSDSDWVHPLKDAFYTNFSLSDQPANVILVDWEGLASNIDYFQSVADTGGVGQIVGNFIIALLDSGVSPEDVHVSGHSLGAHASGFAGKTVYNLTGLTLGRVTGLDPAGPGFYLKSDDQRLTPTDAAVVVVIHTDRGIAGFIDSCGTVDFFPNNGNPPQPGCPLIQAPTDQITDIQDIIPALFGCSHGRAPAFFRGSLTYPGTLIGTECDSNEDYLSELCISDQTLDMGGYVSPSITGNFFLVTEATSPYGES